MMHEPDSSGGKTGRPRVASAILLGVAVLGLFTATRSGMANPAGTALAATANSHGNDDDELDLFVDEPGGRYLVRLQMLMDSSATPADTAAAKAELLARFPGAMAIEHRPGEVTGQFVTSGYTWAGKTADWGYNPSGKKAGLSGEETAINAAAATWAEQGANFRFTGGGTTTAGTEGCSSQHDGHNTVGWAAQPGKVLAVTCSWWTSKGFATEFDMQIDPDWSWTIGSTPSTDLQSVVLHEFGHALGLDHSSDTNAVMFASYKGGTLKRTPNADDRGGIVSLYGASAPPATASPSTPAPSPSAAPKTASPTPATLAVRQGANLMTWPGSDTAPSQALGIEAAAAVRMVYEWDATAREWRRYSPSAPAYVNDLALLRRDHAYWVIAASETSLLVGD